MMYTSLYESQTSFSVKSQQGQHKTSRKQISKHRQFFPRSTKNSENRRYPKPPKRDDGDWTFCIAKTTLAMHLVLSFYTYTKPVVLKLGQCWLLMEHLAMSGATCMQGVEARMLLSIQQCTGQPTKNYPANVSIVQIRNSAPAKFLIGGTLKHHNWV